MSAVSPEQPMLPIEDMPQPIREPFRPEQRRAFGSVPRLVGKGLEIPAPEELNQWAVAHVEPPIIWRGLVGREGSYAVDSIVLSPEEYQTIVRSPKSFVAANQAKTAAANRDANPLRAEEKGLKAGQLPLEGKMAAHRTYLESLASEQDTLATLLEWQRVPGFARTSQIDIVDLGHRAWDLTFRGMLQTLKDQYGFTPEQHIDLTNAMAARLFTGPQRDRVQYWGDMLTVAKRYNSAKSNLFNGRLNKMTRQHGKFVTEMAAYHEKNGLS